jgi:hypothetical protein
MTMHSVSKRVPFIVVECPSKGDAKFASRWLARADEADRILARHRQADPAFERGIAGLGVLYAVDFSWPALAFVSLWLNRGPAYSLSLFDSEWAEAFTYFQGAGFFTQKGPHYEMTLPIKLSPQTIADALLRLAKTEDENYYLHPEHLLATMAEEDALRNIALIEQTLLFACNTDSLQVFH